MNDDELKHLWQQQSLREPPSAEQLVSAIQRQGSEFRRILDRRDLRELLACAFVVIIFGVFFFTVYREPIPRLGDLIVIAGAIFIAWKLIHTRRATPPAPPGATMVESLQAELKAVRAQSRLLGSVLWWYLLPGFIGLMISTWGLRINFQAKIFCTLVFLAADVFVYWLNQWARARQILPAEAQLESLLRSIETGEPLDETHVAQLRPIVLSMKAADRVKPVEFRAAFWQIALYGEIAAIGIWFFLMLGLTMDKEGWATANQGMRAGETNRYAAVAQRIADCFNAGDFTALYRLYDRDMDAVFSLKQTTDFYNGLEAEDGKIEKLDGPFGSSGGWVGFRLHCQHGSLVMSLALDEEDKISGIIFIPAPASNNELPVPEIFSWSRLFSWQHLAWIAPFFLAGLLYSWFLQKVTKRAVGISLLGVHLHKGQNLILWDDIREVRPLRILNICSLRLINESGEKTIMPWTSLERHSELRSAVDGSAPPNHPIRKYLSLLRRS